MLVSYVDQLRPASQQKRPDRRFVQNDERERGLRGQLTDMIVSLQARRAGVNDRGGDVDLMLYELRHNLPPGLVVSRVYDESANDIYVVVVAMRPQVFWHRQFNSKLRPWFNRA